MIGRSIFLGLVSSASALAALWRTSQDQGRSSSLSLACSTPSRNLSDCSPLRRRPSSFVRWSLILLSRSAGAIFAFTCSSVLWTLFWSSADNNVWASNMSRLIDEYVPWFGAVLPADKVSIWSLVGASPGGQHAKANLASESTRLSMRASISSVVRFTSRPLDFSASFDSSKVPMVLERDARLKSSIDYVTCCLSLKLMFMWILVLIPHVCVLFCDVNVIAVWSSTIAANVTHLTPH